MANDLQQGPDKVSGGSPWGLAATAGFSLVLIIAVLIVQILMMQLLAVSAPLWSGDFGLSPESPPALTENGLALSLMILAVTPVAIALCIVFSRMREGIRVAEYLGWRMVNRRVLLKWLGLLGLFVLVSDMMTFLTQGYLVHSFLLEAYRTARLPSLLWLALVAGAPLYEEFIFRGFMFKGLQHAVTGPAGAVVITSAVWAMLHVQYDAYAMGVILAFGLFLGIARWLSGSLILTILLHALLNLASIIQMLVYLWWTGNDFPPV